MWQEESDSMFFKLIHLTLVLVNLISIPLPVLAAGTIRGKVSFSGSLPSPEKFVFRLFPMPSIAESIPRARM